MRIAGMGHAVFAATLIVLGVLGLIRGDFTPIWQGAPANLPARDWLACACAVIALVCGVGLLWPRSAASSARLLSGCLLLWMLAFKLRVVLLHPAVEDVYQGCGENAVLVAGAWVLYARFATDGDRRWFGFATGDRGVRIAQGLYALAMLAFGLSHFFYVNLTAPLVPGWLPWHVAWAYFTGCAYLAAGVAILAGVHARMAIALSALQMGLFTLLVWVPAVAGGHASPSQWSELILSWALTAAAWVVADSSRGTTGSRNAERGLRAPQAPRQA